MSTATSKTAPIILVSLHLDLYGLDVFQFRLYAHISHRGKCYSTLQRMATVCKMSVSKAQQSLKNLCELGLINKTKRILTTDIYVIEPIENWKNREEINLLNNEIIDSQYQQPIFVNAILDLYGLNPYDFRIYAHIAACGGSCESNFEQIKAICKMSVRKAQYSIKNLCDLGLIKKIKYKGKKTFYVMTSSKEWKEPEYSEELDDERKKIKKYLTPSEEANNVTNTTDY